MNDRVIKSRSSELLVANYLCSQGLRLVAKNYRGVGFELDLIFCHRNTLIFVEVKYRKKAKNSFNQLEQIINPRQLACLYKGIHWFIKSPMCPYHLHVRVDYAVVNQDNKIFYFKNVDISQFDL